VGRSSAFRLFIEAVHGVLPVSVLAS